MILHLTMSKKKYTPGIYSAGIDDITIQTELSKRRPGVISRLFFFILEPMRIFYGLRITLTIEKSRHRVKGKITLLTKLSGTFDVIFSHVYWRGYVILGFLSTANTLFTTHPI
jgi:hypothetical protein